MLVKEVKRIGKVGKKLLEDKNAKEVIDIIIEKPLRKACKHCLEKNIETVMSSANEKNVVEESKRRTKKEVIKMFYCVLKKQMNKYPILSIKENNFI